MPLNWKFALHDEAQIRRLSGEMRISPLLAQVLLSRGHRSRDTASLFLDAKLLDLHDPELLPGISEAADRIVGAIRAGRRITIYGDYDVDGVTATSLLWHCLQLAGAQVDYYIPSRLDEGYGLNCEAITQLHQDDPNRLLVSVDCGIVSVREAAVARELGLELIITDHHHVGDQLPDAACLVHPRLPGSQYPFGELCGVGVAFKLAWAIGKRLGDREKSPPHIREFLKRAVALAAIGTIADVVPLVDENRLLVRFGLARLLDSPSIGLQALLQVCELSAKKNLQAEDVAFAIAPRINAAGRLGQARLAVELLTTDNPQRATALAEYLDQLNKNRRSVELKIFKQAKELVNANSEWESHKTLVLAHREWHPGVIGIVANRVAEHFSKSTILVAVTDDGVAAQGSGRAFGSFDLHAALAACAEHLDRFGGHQAAAGLRIVPGKLDGFREALARHADSCPDTRQADHELAIDAEVRLSDCTHAAVCELERLGPFGQGNLRPVFAASRVSLTEPPRKMGEGERHLSLRIKQHGAVMRAVAFGRGEWADEIAAQQGTLSISFAPVINNFQGRANVELQLIDWRSEAPGPATNAVPQSAAVR